MPRAITSTFRSLACAKCDEALNHGILRQVEEQRRPLHRPALLEVGVEMMTEFSSPAFWVSLIWRMVWWERRDVRHQAHDVHQRPLRQLRLCRDEPPRGADAVFPGRPRVRQERARSVQVVFLLYSGSIQAVATQYQGIIYAVFR